MTSDDPTGQGTLFVVATPIGNLGDLSPRAAEVLRLADVVVAEDTRRTRTLLTHVGAHPGDLLSLPAFDEEGRLGRVVARLAAGAAVALVTDAGTPGVSDPGSRLVEVAWGVGARVVPVPGPSAALAALVLFEAGNRASSTLADLQEALGDREAALARELTKLHEEIARGRLSELRIRFPGDLRGEVTVVVAGADALPAEEPAGSAEEEILRRLAEGEAPTAVARAIARGRAMGRSEAYALVESVRGRR